MSNELPQAEQDKKTFSDMFADDDNYDAGLDKFNQAVANAESMLNSNGGAQSFSRDHVFDTLNNEWPFHDNVAKISGKVYVRDSDIVELAPGTWSEPAHDELGTYFMVSDVELTSMGIIDASDYTVEIEKEGSIITPVKIAYGFNPAHIDSDDAVLFAYPDDILSMQYGFPTLEAITMRLHHRWPKEMRAVDMLIEQGANDWNTIIRRLNALEQKINVVCENSDEFREWLAYYIYNRIKIDKEPYMVECKGKARYMNEDGDWIPFTFVDNAQRYLTVAGIGISTAKNDKEASSQFIVSFVEPAAVGDFDKSYTQIAMPATTINRMTSTRPSPGNSVASIVENADFYPEPITEGGESEMEIYQGFEGGSHIMDRESPMTEFDRLEKIEAIIKAMQAEAMRSRKIQYDTEEEAASESRRLMNLFNEWVSEIGLDEYDVFSVSGPGVLSLNMKIDLGNGNFGITIDGSNKYVSPEPGVDVVGGYDGLNVAIRELVDEDGNVAYIAAPQIVINSENIRINLSGSGYPIAPLGISKKSLVMLDENCEITIPKLDRMRDKYEAIAMFALSHRRELVVKDIAVLDQAFRSTHPDNWYELKQLRRLRRVAREIMVDQEKHVDTVEAMRQLLLGRIVQVVGDAWIAGEFKESAKDIVGRIVDVAMTHPFAQSIEPVIIIDPEHRPGIDPETAMPPVYMRLSTIEHLSI